MQKGITSCHLSGRNLRKRHLTFCDVTWHSLLRLKSQKKQKNLVEEDEQPPKGWDRTKEQRWRHGDNESGKHHGPRTSVDWANCQSAVSKRTSQEDNAGSMWFGEEGSTQRQNTAEAAFLQNPRTNSGCFGRCDGNDCKHKEVEVTQLLHHVGEYRDGERVWIHRIESWDPRLRTQARSLRMRRGKTSLQVRCRAGGS